MTEMTLEYLVLCLVIMFLVTYGLRMVSLVFLRKKLTGKFIYSFLSYTPYGVLGAMIFPDIFFFTQTGVSITAGEFICAAVGFATAVILSLFKRGLTTVSLGAVVAVFIVQQLMQLI